ncbi:AAA family ATPase [Streptomyces sp. NPDC056638]|uniref:AAA family ATPase n=1 Tax=Streptomyces sp. NPDC056638 TaxID=3345887 RepID=UPI003674AA2B
MWTDTAFLAGSAHVEVHSRLLDLVGQGRDAVLDHGLWDTAGPCEAQKLVEDAGGRPRMLYFPVDREELLRRLAARNLRQDAGALTVAESSFEDFVARFEPPHGEGDEIPVPGAL